MRAGRFRPLGDAMTRLLVLASLTLALSALGAAAQVGGAWAKGCGCVCNKCSEPCQKCAPEWCGSMGSGGWRAECIDACCPPKVGVDRVCVESWDLCMKWCDGKIHHPYELSFNGNGMLCDTG